MYLELMVRLERERLGRLHEAAKRESLAKGRVRMGGAPAKLAPLLRPSQDAVRYGCCQGAA